MLRVRRSNDRGMTKIGWLDSRHSFSFGHYDDPDHVHFGPLRVINEDIVAPGGKFDMHPHRNMEILTWVLDGALEHADSLGTGSVIRPGDIQRMTAGRGILHSEANASTDQAVHLLQIWIIPEATGLTPSYEEKNFTAKRGPGRLVLLASRDGRDDSVTINQDASLSVLDLDDQQSFTYEPANGRAVWLQMARGSAMVNGEHLAQGDAAALTDEAQITITGQGPAEILVFDLVL